MTHQDVLVKKVGNDEIRLRTWTDYKHTLASIETIGLAYVIGTIFTSLICVGAPEHDLLSQIGISLVGGIFAAVSYFVIFIGSNFPYITTIPSYRVYLARSDHNYEFPITNTPADTQQICKVISQLEEKAKELEEESNKLVKIVEQCK